MELFRVACWPDTHLTTREREHPSSLLVKAADPLAAAASALDVWSERRESLGPIIYVYRLTTPEDNRPGYVYEAIQAPEVFTTSLEPLDLEKDLPESRFGSCGAPIRSAMTCGPYWMEWVDDSGDPEDNSQASFPNAAALASSLKTLLTDLGYGQEAEHQLAPRSLADVASALGAGQQYELDLPTGRLYFGLADRPLPSGTTDSGFCSTNRENHR
jgi:hypothetical protein